MVGIQLLDFQVKSTFKHYDVQFVDDIAPILGNKIFIDDVIIIDKKLEKLYSYLWSELDLNQNILFVEASEDQKSYDGLKIVIEKLIYIGFKKNHRLIGIGGGIIQDITAFISSIMYRGVKWIFIPTTLLAQGDSCIGSKTSINFGEFKNQLGGFYPPDQIFINLNFLNSLSKKDIKSGIGEMCHYFIIDSERSFKNYKKNYLKIKTDKKILGRMISESLKIKKKMIEIDEFDQNERQVFNYGHSFGHAIESLTNYKIPHGIAVSFGMDIANFISVKEGFLKKEIRFEIRTFLKQLWEEFSIKNINVKNFIIALSKDKKNIDNELRLILCSGYGEVFKFGRKADDEFQSWLEEYFRYEAS